MKVLIIGGAGGIGHATAEEIMRRGDKVFIVDLPGTSAPPGASLIEADLSTRYSVRGMVEAFQEKGTAGG